MLLLQKLLPLSLFAALARLGGLLLTVTAVVTGGQVSTVTSTFYVFLGQKDLAKTRRTMHIKRKAREITGGGGAFFGIIFCQKGQLVAATSGKL